MALIDQQLPDLIFGTVYGLTGSQLIVITRRTGATGDPDTLEESGASPESQTLKCGAPWPYTEAIGSPGVYRELGVAEAQTEVSGRDPNFVFAPRHGMYATLDGQSWLLVDVHHDLDADTYRLLMRRS